MPDLQEGDMVEVWNPRFTGARGVVAGAADDGRYVRVRWTDGMSKGVTGFAMKSLLRVVPSGDEPVSWPGTGDTA